MRRLLGFLVQCAAVALGCLILSGFAGSCHPLFDSLAHFRFHFTTLLIPVFLLLLLLKRCGAAWMVLLFAAFSVFSMNPLSPLSNLGGGTRLSLVQFNALFKNPTPQKAADWIKSEAPDVVTLQEVSRQSRAIMDVLKPELPYQVFCDFATVGGVAILSRHPIIVSKCVRGEGFAWARLDVNGKEVTVASLHLHWPWPYGQWQQISRLRPEMQAMPRPVFLAGDFNAAPWSAAVKEIAKATDTTIVSGLRLTLRIGPPPLGPMRFMPIDHVLIPKDAAFWDVNVGPQIGSDHHPVTALLGICCEAM